MTKEEMLEAIKEMSVLELSNLVKSLEEEFGISAAVPIATAPAASAPDETATAVEEQTEFNVVLQEIGANKINVIKAVREVTTLGLREAKELVESAPKAIREGITKQEAEEITQKLSAAGAKISIQ